MALRSNAITSKALGPSGKREGEERERERESQKLTNNLKK